MFEKEAFNYGMIYAKTTLLNTNGELEQAYKDGAEFGYNKANEWHDLRKNPNDLPEVKQGKSFSEVLVREAKIYEIASFTEKTFFAEGEDITKDVIAWREIPQFKE